MVSVIEEHIEINPEIRGGEPHLKGTRMTVADIVLVHLRLGQSLEEIAGKYEVSLASLHAAMDYYFDHRDDIDRRMQEDIAFAEAFRRDNPSPLQEKLKKLGKG